MSSGEWIMDNLDPENYGSHWERCIKVGLFNLQDVEEIYKKGLVNDNEYQYAIDYLTEELQYAN